MTYYKSDYISIIIRKMKYMDMYLRHIFLHKLEDNEILDYKNYFNIITESHSDYNTCIICRDIYNMKFRIFLDYIKNNNILIPDDNWNQIYSTMSFPIMRNNRTYLYIKKIKNNCFYYHIINKSIYKELPSELKLMIRDYLS